MNEYQPLGKKEKADAPVPKPPVVQKEKPAPREKPNLKPRVVRERKEGKPRSLIDDIVPWDEDAEDFSSYVDINIGRNYD
jgi:hypothetical protein